MRPSKNARLQFADQGLRWQCKGFGVLLQEEDSSAQLVGQGKEACEGEPYSAADPS